MLYPLSYEGAPCMPARAGGHAAEQAYRPRTAASALPPVRVDHAEDGLIRRARHHLLHDQHARCRRGVPLLERSSKRKDQP